MSLSGISNSLGKQSNMDKVLFGDNQFFGVNHMSEEKARAQSMRFRDTNAMIEVLDMAYEAGIKTFMCTTHDRIGEICNYFRVNASRYPDFHFYPGMPYAHKYANAVTDHGIVGAIKRFLPDEGLIDAVMRGGSALAKKEIDGIATLLIDAEMKMFAGLSTPVIFLQNVVTDFLLGLDMKVAFRIFADHVKAKYNAEPGFFTMNLPKLLDVLEEVGVENPIVCSNINKIGFRMCGGIDTYEKILQERQFRPIAMSVLASGAIPPGEAIEYVCKLPKIQSIVFGASSRGNIQQTKALIDKFMAEKNAG